MQPVVSTPRLIHAAEALVTIPDLLNYWLSRQPGIGIHQRNHHPVCRCKHRQLGNRPAAGARSALAPFETHRETRNCHRRTQERRFRRACGHAGGRAGMPRHRIRCCRSILLRQKRLPEFRNMVPARSRNSRARDHTEGARPEFHERRGRLRNHPAAEKYRRSLAPPILQAMLGGFRPRLHL